AVRAGGGTIVTTRRVPGPVTVFSVRKRRVGTVLESKLQKWGRLAFRADRGGKGVRSAKEFGLGKVCGLRGGFRRSGRVFETPRSLVFSPKGGVRGINYLPAQRAETGFLAVLQTAIPVPIRNPGLRPGRRTPTPSGSTPSGLEDSRPPHDHCVRPPTPA